MRPELSAIGMNSAGEIAPRLGCSQRSSASKPAISPSSSRTIGWKASDSSLRLEGAAQVGFQLQPAGAGALVGRPERLDAVAAEALGLVHGQLGLLQHVLGGSRRSVQPVMPSEPVRMISRPPKEIGALIASRSDSAKATMARDLASRR